jgi:hypothetical protein
MAEVSSVPWAKKCYYRFVLTEVEMQMLELGTSGNEGDESPVDRRSVKLSDNIARAE